MKNTNDTPTASFHGHPYSVPSDVNLNEKEEAVLKSLLDSAGGNGYDFGFTDYDEATEEAKAMMPKGVKSWRSYCGSLQKKGLISTYGTEYNEQGAYSQFDVTMPEFTIEAVEEGIKATLVIDEKFLADESENANRVSESDQISVEDLMNFKLFYSKRKLFYSVSIQGFDNDYAILKGNKADFYAKLEKMDPKEMITAIIDEDSIIIG